MKIVDKNNRPGDNKAMFWKLKRIHGTLTDHHQAADPNEDWEISFRKKRHVNKHAKKSESTGRRGEFECGRKTHSD
jgi:hypothetical protein